MNGDEAKIVSGLEQEETEFRSWLLSIDPDAMQEFLRMARTLARAKHPEGTMVGIDAKVAAIMASCTMMCATRVWASVKGVGL